MFRMASAWHRMTPSYAIIKNFSPHFSLRQRRLWTPSELLIAQGFPVLPRLVVSRHPQSTNFARCTSLCSSDGKAKILTDPRTIKSMCEQAGNSMQLPVCGAVLLYVCLFLTTESDTDDDTTVGGTSTAASGIFEVVPQCD